MPVNVRIPTPLRTYTEGQDQLKRDATTVGELLDTLAANHDGLGRRLFKEPGRLNRFVNIYVNDEDVRFLDQLQTPLKDGDEVSIVPAIAGG